MDIICKADNATQVISLKPNGDIIVRGELIVNDINLYNAMVDKLKNVTYKPTTIYNNLQSSFGLTFIDPVGKEIFRFDKKNNYIGDKIVDNKAMYSALNVWCGIGQ